MQKTTLSLLFLLLLYIACRQPERPYHIAELPVGIQNDEDTRWILQILNYESCCGSAGGTGLPYWGMYNDKPTSIDSAYLFFKTNYLPRVKKYPLGLRERLGDYYFNTGRSPEQLLMYAAGYLTLDQINSKQRFQDKWKKYQPVIQSRYNDPGFLLELDRAKEKVYQTTHMENGQPNSAYALTWKPRIWMWKK